MPGAPVGCRHSRDFRARCSRQTQGLADGGLGQTGEEGDLGNRVALGGKLANDPHLLGFLPCHKLNELVTRRDLSACG